jgi:UDPglucose--hexose-1-phosphate uridylyltransferase
MAEHSPHRRFNPLRDEWVVVSPHRTERPWQGQVDAPDHDRPPHYDPSCYLCPGNKRAHGATNPRYTATFAFDNDFPALLPNESQIASPESPESQIPSPESRLFLAERERGLCRVLCFSPRHDLTLSRMAATDIQRVVEMWVEECADAAAQKWVSYALVFENRGAMMGASNPHPHGQLWATEHVPNEPAREGASFARYRAGHGGCLLCDYAAREAERGERIVCENDAFIALVPFWAVWPFETLVVSRRHVGALADLDQAERQALADILKRLTTRYDNLFAAPFPYSMGFHQQPVNDAAGGDWHLHAHFFPPLLRSASIRKFMVGFELLGAPQRDLTPEDAAARLRALSELHYADALGAP